MRVCVAHLLSFLVVLLALVMNLYFLIRGHSEFSSLSRTLHKQENEASLDDQLSDLVEGSIKSYEHQIDELEHQLKEIRQRLDDYSNVYSVNSNDDQSFETASLVNYADEQLGATIRTVRAEPVTTRQSFMDWSQTTNPPANIIRSSMEPGCCYAFKNGNAEIEIKLAKEVHVECIKIEHIPRSLSPTKDTSSAPRNFSVYGVDTYTGDQIHLGDFEFTNKMPSEVFVLSIKRMLRIIRFKFTNNHGHPKYTCVYRVLVYGEPT